METKKEIFTKIEDAKPFRNRPNRNILGFMTEDIVTHWAEL